LQGELQAADWQPSPQTDADNPDQIGLFDGIACRYRVFATSIRSEKGSPAGVAAFYNKRAAVENLIQASNHEIGLTAHPSGQWAMNASPCQLSRIAYNLNCWLKLFEREESVTVPELRHRTVATNRLRLLYLAARITRHGGRTEIHCGSQYQGRNRFDQWMVRLRSIEGNSHGFGPVVHTPLRP
jgi:hypothetical protein